MVFVFCQIRGPKHILKTWYGSQVEGTRRLDDVYNDFAAGILDEGEFSARICESIHAIVLCVDL